VGVELGVVVEELGQERAPGALDLRDQDQRLAHLDEPCGAMAHDLVQVLSRPRLVPRRRRPTALERTQGLLGLPQAEPDQAEGDGLRAALTHEAPQAGPEPRVERRRRSVEDGRVLGLGGWG